TIAWAGTSLFVWGGRQLRRGSASDVGGCFLRAALSFSASARNGGVQEPVSTSAKISARLEDREKDTFGGLERRRYNASKICERVSFINGKAAKYLSNITGEICGRNAVAYRTVVFPLAGAVAVLVPASVPCKNACR
ncbi:MAG: hypothetical protein GY820_19575, partial [Gammaproteobacteria bacterium]|nr:hypothetical protein [Gammaproteobacteria bacterium]